jgi:hypothetical protein
MYAQQTLYSSVEIDVRDTNGDRLDTASVVLSPTYGGKNWEASGKVPVKMMVPTGLFTMQADAHGFETRRELLRVYYPRVLRTITLLDAYHGLLNSGLTGSVRNYPADRNTLRVRLVALYGNELMETAVDKRGSFSFPADPGFYLLMTIDDRQGTPSILDSRAIRVQGKESIVVDLKGKEQGSVGSH